MANITLEFSNPLPEGIQVTDIAWYLDVDANPPVEVEMGPITSITQGPPTWTVIVNADVGVVPPDAADFIFYEKNPITYIGSLKGYYAEVQFINNATDYAELYSVGAEVFESSK